MTSDKTHKKASSDSGDVTPGTVRQFSAGARGLPFPVHELHFEVDVTPSAGLGHPVHIAAELLIPAGQTTQLLFVCVPGGGMNRRYFDLTAPSGEPTASFTHAMLARGHAVLLIDPLGVGGSTLPQDAYMVHPDAMAASNAMAVRRIVEKLRAGTLGDGIAPAPHLRSIGVGHSLGALLTIVQQAADPLHDALALFGFHTCGLPAQLGPQDIGLDLADARSRLVELARQRFPMAFIPPTVKPASRSVSAAEAIDRIYLTPSYMAMLPEIIAPDAAAIEVPILLAVGDGDLHAEPHRMPSAYPGSRDVTLVVLENTRHNHFVYPSRTLLFDRVARWSETL